ncbi:hypothetical protein EV186_1011944 [Labedaea rhizosphaerae]|uniref:GyrI-like small molecule binding protein n=1 Tax=Labedaea rhizosphaerae TaxID=598644 RepID=A0A4R6SN59_LABRH|nr:hypothetical protein EV186_1011944 [Labedaea rhizosphaerae]
MTKQPRPLLVRRVPDELPALQQGWAEFEELVGLRGRKFYGLVDVAANEYLLATVPRDDDPADAWGLARFELPGGDYLRTVLRGEPPELYSRIGPAMQELESLTTVDKERYLVEFYKRHNEIELWVPVHGSA